MTVPRQFQSSFYFQAIAGVTDVANAITTIIAALLAQTPAWTNPTGNTVNSPVDSAGRFMKITFTATTALRLRMTVVDQNGLTVSDREMDISSGNTINFYSGQFHLYVESPNLSTPEWVGAFMLDPYPYDYSNLPNYIIGGGYRTTAGAIDGAGTTFDLWFMIENGASVNRQRVQMPSFNSSGTAIGLPDFAGNLMFYPVMVSSVIGTVQQWAGMMCQAYITDIRVQSAVVKPVAIDDSTPASFKATAANQIQNVKLMLRVA